MKEGLPSPTWHVSCVSCQGSRVTFDVSYVTCQVSAIIFLIKKIGQSVEANWMRVCYQRGLPRLVFIHFQQGQFQGKFLGMNKGDFFCWIFGVKNIVLNNF